jgi:hypothetical protein
MEATKQVATQTTEDTQKATGIKFCTKRDSFEISPYVDLQDNSYWVAQGVEPPCALSCGCIDLKTRHLSDSINRYLDQLLIAVRMICDLRELPQNTQNMNDVWGEIHDVWLAGLEQNKKGEAA